MVLVVLERSGAFMACIDARGGSGIPLIGRPLGGRASKGVLGMERECARCALRRECLAPRGMHMYIYLMD